MERFACCSSYIECSDIMQCLHMGDPDYEGCIYRKKLEAGIAFYGTNAGKKEKQEAARNRPCTIYLACFGQLFAVMARNKNTFSYSLNEEQAGQLREIFDQCSIPYRTKLDFQDVIEGEPIEDDSPCTSRTVFSIDEQEYNVLNFNAYLIKAAYADRIKKAFERKGISSRVELIGSSKAPWQGNSWKYEQIQPPKIEDKPAETVKHAEPTGPQKPIRFEQTTIFGLLLRKAAV